MVLSLHGLTFALQYLHILSGWLSSECCRCPGGFVGDAQMSIWTALSQTAVYGPGNASLILDQLPKCVV